MHYALLVVLLAVNALSAAEWTAPENPDPSAILDEAQDDAQAKRYETALAKHVWFHEHALSIEPGLYGVRLSFALSYWQELAEKFPPALDKLIEIRDEAKTQVLEGTDIYKPFHDMESINDRLGESLQTKDVFTLLDEKHPDKAKTVFDRAQASLVEHKAYALIGKYILPKEDFAKMQRDFAHHKIAAHAAAKPEHGEMRLNFAKKNFTNQSTTLVAILVVNERIEEAKEIASLARKEWDDESFHAAIDDALKGVVPEPWP